MAADPNSFDHYRRGEVTPVLRGKVDNAGFDYYCRAEPYRGMVMIAVVAAVTARLRTLVGFGT